MRLKQRVWSEKVFLFFLMALYWPIGKAIFFENLAQLYPLPSWTCNYIPLLDTWAMLDYRYTEFSGYFWEYYLDSKGIQHIKWVANRRVQNARIMYHFKLEHLMSHNLWLINYVTLILKDAENTLEIVLKTFFNLELGPFQTNNFVGWK